MSNVILITFHEDLGSALKNKLRGKMEYAAWRKEWIAAEAAGDYWKLDRLDEQYNMIGLP